MKVLLTDDSMTIRIIIRDLLKELGYTDITECRNGEEAWNTLQREHFDLILLDIHMPQMDGLTVLEKIKSEPNMGNECVPVVFISSDTDYRQIERAKSLKAFGYIKKPFKKNGLQRAIIAAENAEKKRQAQQVAEGGAVPKAAPTGASASAKTSESTTQDKANPTTGDGSQEGAPSWMRSILGK